MAAFLMTVTVPNDDAADMFAALRFHFGLIEDPVESGDFRERTDEELIVALADGTAKSMKQIYANHQRYLHELERPDGEIDIGVEPAPVPDQGGPL